MTTEPIANLPCDVRQRDARRRIVQESLKCPDPCFEEESEDPRMLSERFQGVEAPVQEELAFALVTEDEWPLSVHEVVEEKASRHGELEVLKVKVVGPFGLV
jgi:hypothetical protein